MNKRNSSHGEQRRQISSDTDTESALQKLKSAKSAIEKDASVLTTKLTVHSQSQQRKRK